MTQSCWPIGTVAAARDRHHDRAARLFYRTNARAASILSTGCKLELLPTLNRSTTHCTEAVRGLPITMHIQDRDQLSHTQTMCLAQLPRFHKVGLQDQNVVSRAMLAKPLRSKQTAGESRR